MLLLEGVAEAALDCARDVLTCPLTGTPRRAINPGKSLLIPRLP